MISQSEDNLVELRTLSVNQGAFILLNLIKEALPFGSDTLEKRFPTVKGTVYGRIRTLAYFF